MGTRTPFSERAGISESPPRDIRQGKRRDKTRPDPAPHTLTAHKEDKGERE